MKLLEAISLGGLLIVYALFMSFPIHNAWSEGFLTAGVLFAFITLCVIFYGKPKKLGWNGDERGNISPLALLVIAVGTIIFEALVFGEALVESSIISTIDNPSCSDTLGALETIACWTRFLGIGLANVFIMIASVVRFFANALTFNIPGAPIYVRLIFGTVMIGGIGLMIAGLFRGTKA